ncbi:SHOCT domain-containing protein [Actinophytocola sp. NPDC049390]|uniref:SHOCT domain-containing protein n=1 Tax=Actinophytocola sp. NPDC049390 TaxID=3363894 RepID=UPI003789EDFA
MKIRLVIGALAAVAAWFVLRDWAYVSGDIEWTCYGNGECGTNDGRVMLVVAGVALAVLALVLLATVLRVAGVGLMLAVAPLAMVSGWEAAFADRQVEVLSDQVGFWRVVAIVGGVVAVLGLLIEWRLPGPTWRLLGWARVPAELDDFRDGMATLSFTDLEGRPHAVRVRAPEQLRGQPVRAYYLVRDPSRARPAPGKQPVLTTNDKDDDDSLSTELTRLAALHAEGHLTDVEFEQAKRRVLDR